MSKPKEFFLKRVMPKGAFLQKICVLAIILCIFFIGQNVYQFYLLKQQEAVLAEEKERLLEERRDLELKQADLEDKKKLEKRARDELGMFKPDEIPYIQTEAPSQNIVDRE